MAKLDFGLLLAFRNPPTWRRPWDEIYEEHINQAKVAEELGYDTVWLTEHHFLGGRLVPSSYYPLQPRSPLKQHN